MTVIIDGTTGISGVDGSSATPAMQGNDSNTGISYGTDTVTINTGGVARVTTDASGNVGIGTALPSVEGKLTVSGSAASFTRPAIIFANTAAGGRTYRLSSTDDGSYNFLDQTANVERMRITSAGLVGINNSSPTQRLSVTGSINVPQGNQIIAGSTAIYSDGSIGLPSLQWNAFVGQAVGAVSIADTTSTATSVYFRNPNGFVGNITTTGSSTAYVTTSDYRLKENVAPMQNALVTVAALKPCTYTWKADGGAGQGFIAHELQEVVPDCVTGEKDAVSSDGSPIYQGVDTSFLVATLVAAIQELKAEFDAYKAAHP